MRRDGAVILQEGSPSDTDNFLDRLICTACGRGCSLLNPQCGSGTQQVEEAKAIYLEYTSQSTTQEDSSSSESTDQSTLPNTDTANLPDISTEHQHQNRGQDIPLFDNVIGFLNNMAILGLFIAGTYYILSFSKRK